MNWYVKVLKQYADFNGRATRQEFWMFVLFNFLISIVLSFINEYLSSIYSLAILIPSLAVGARRLHDIGKSGWMQLVSLIPLAGIIWLIVLFATEGTPDENEYGAVPKEVATEE